MYWTNDILDPDQKTTFVLGHDTNMNYMTRYNNPTVKDLVAAARIEMDPAKREQMYIQIQELAKEDAHWIDLYYPYRNVSRKNIENFYQNPLGRFFLEDTVRTEPDRRERIRRRGRSPRRPARRTRKLIRADALPDLDQGLGSPFGPAGQVGHRWREFARVRRSSGGGSTECSALGRIPINHGARRD